MAFTIGTITARGSALTANPITASITIGSTDKVLVVMMKNVLATERTGGALTYGSQTLLEPVVPQKAAAAPECVVYLYYLLDPTVGTATLTIPNAGGLTMWHQIVTARCSGTVSLVTSAGANNTSTNPSPGALTIGTTNNIIFSCVSTGAQTWSPSAQTGTVITNNDDGSHGGGTQYTIQDASGNHTPGWTFGTSEDWGAIAAVFSETAAVVPPINSINNYMRFKSSGLSVGVG